MGFHPCFATKNEGDIVLRTADGTDFYFRLQLLAELSSFFHGLLDGPVKLDEDSDNVIDLTHANTGGLAYALELLPAYVNGRSCIFDATCVSDALQVGTAYDLPAIGAALFISGFNSFHDKPVVLYALAAMVHDHKLAGALGQLTIGENISAMPSWASKALLVHNPAQYISLYKLHASYSNSLSSLKSALISEHRMHDRNEDFSDSCRKDPGCKSKKRFKGDFFHLRATAARAVFDVCQLAAWAGARHPIEIATHGLVDCGQCSARLINTFIMTYEEHRRRRSM